MAISRLRRISASYGRPHPVVTPRARKAPKIVYTTAWQRYLARLRALVRAT